MPSTLNIAALAKRTGVRADTIRKWEQRYGVLCPERTIGGQRRYSEHDVARVEWLKARLAEGYRIGEASALLGDAHADAPLTPAQLRDAVYGAVVASDVESLVRFVEQALALNTLEEALTDVLAPVLAAVGERWEAGELTVAQEHLATGVVRAHLEKLLADVRGGVRGTAVLACAPGELHELGLLMFAVLLRADGWQVAYLGPTTPIADAVELSVRSKARVLCLSATMPDASKAALQALAARHVPDGIDLVLGGPAFSPQTARAAGGRYLGADLAKGTATLRKLAR